MKSPNCLAIMALLAEMVRRVNENLDKIDFKPLAITLDTSGAVKRKAGAQRKKV